MSRPLIEQLRRQLAQAESSNDVTIAKLKGGVTFLQKALAQRQERDDAIIAALNEDRISLEAQVHQVISEVNAVIADLSGAAKHIDASATAQLQAAE